MEPLKILSDDRLPMLLEKLHSKFPETIATYCYVKAQINDKKLRKDFNFKIYCPEGDMGNGIIILSDVCEKYQISVQPINDNKSLLEKSLFETKLIDWSKKIIISPASKYVTELMMKLKIQLKLNVDQSLPCPGYLLQSDAQFVDRCPPNTYVSPMEAKHLNIVDKTWRFHSDTSYKYLETLLNNGRAFMMYSTMDKNPLSWVFISESGLITHLYTLRKYRRLGYGQYMAKYAANILIKENKNALTYIKGDNIQSQKLFKKLNFIEIDSPVGLVVTKQ